MGFQLLEFGQIYITQPELYNSAGTGVVLPQLLLYVVLLAFKNSVEVGELLKAHLCDISEITSAKATKAI